MYRKRAWDLLREEFARVDEGASLAEAVRALRAAQDTSPELPVVLVLNQTGGLVGAVSQWTILAALDECVLRDPDSPWEVTMHADAAFAHWVVYAPPPTPSHTQGTHAPRYRR